MENLPIIVITSCSNTKPKSLIKLITKESAKEDSPGIIYQPWQIDTKYYTANVNIIGLDEKSTRTEDFNSKVEAIILHMDANRSTGLEDLKRWECLETDCDPEIKLLISNYCTDDTKISKNEAIEWCLKRNFEFIELYPAKNQNEDEVEIIPEKFGVNRVIEALQTHTWSNLEMKSSKNKVSMHKEDSSSSDFHEDEFITDDADDFTELFSQLHMMKDSLQSMPTNQRKQCAEQMVTAFWKAIGGEEEEISDI